MRWYPLKANFSTAGDQLVGSCRDLTHEILPCVLRVGLDGCQRRLGVAADNNGEDWYRADVLQGHRDSHFTNGLTKVKLRFFLKEGGGGGDW